MTAKPNAYHRFKDTY